MLRDRRSPRGAKHDRVVLAIAPSRAPLTRFRMGEAPASRRGPRALILWPRVYRELDKLSQSIV